MPYRSYVVQTNTYTYQQLHGYLVTYGMECIVVEVNTMLEIVERDFSEEEKKTLVNYTSKQSTHYKTTVPDGSGSVTSDGLLASRRI